MGAIQVKVPLTPLGLNGSKGIEYLFRLVGLLKIYEFKLLRNVLQKYDPEIIESIILLIQILDSVVVLIQTITIL